MILNIMVKRFGMKYMEAQRHIYAHVNTVSPIISEALDIITAESPGGRIHLCIQRNFRFPFGEIQSSYQSNSGNALRAS